MQEIFSPEPIDLPNFQSMTDEIIAKAKTAPEQIAFHTEVNGKIEKITCKTFTEQFLSLARGFYAKGIRKNDRVAILGNTRYEWILLDYAITHLGGIVVPIYPTSSAKQIEWILADSEAKMLIVESDSNLNTVRDITKISDSVKDILIIDNSEKTIYELLKDLGTDISEKAIAKEHEKIKNSDLSSIVYTSGTTGKPKGCCLTHQNFMSEANGIYASSLVKYITPENDFLIFLPLAHVLSRSISHFAIDKGMRLSLTNDTKNLTKYFKLYNPTVILAVPRIFEKLFATAENSAAETGKTKIFNKSVKTAIAYAQKKSINRFSFTKSAQHKVFEKLIYKKITSNLGERMELAISGGAPIDDELLYFFQGIGLTIYEGYGLTETCASITVNSPNEIKIGSVGKPLADNGIRIAEDGEVLATGSVVFSKYWKNPEATAAAFTDKWFHTGDLGRLDEEGYLYITGRKKDIIITAGGKNVVPSNFENKLKSHSLISNALLVGNQKPFVSALITLDSDTLPLWKKILNIDPKLSKNELLENEKIIETIKKEIDKINATVSRAEGVKKFIILPDDFSEETGELTPSLKIKRSVVENNRADVIESIYSK